VSTPHFADDSRASYAAFAYYEALRLSTYGWHEAEHDLAPWTDYFLGILIAACKEFESRAGALGGRGSKRALIVTFVDSLLTDEFTVSEIRENAPGVSDGWINQVLSELKREGVIEPLGTGRSARWRRLR
jgi:Fic family protein